MYAVLSNPSVIGWKITMKVVYLEIWRETPVSVGLYDVTRGQSRVIVTYY